MVETRRNEPRSPRTALIAFVALSLLAACKKDPPPTPATPVTVDTRAPEVRIPLPTSDPRDPILEWRLELTRKRLSLVAGLNWQCLPGPEGGILVEVPAACPEFVKAQLPGLPPLECQGNRLLAPRRPCAPSAANYPALFDHLRFSEGSSLYRTQPGGNGLVPLSPDLPPFRFGETGEDPLLGLPPARTWLKQGGTTGAFSVELEVENDDAESWNALGKLLESSAEAIDLPLFLDRSRAPLLGKGGGSGGKPPSLFLTVQGLQPGIYGEACRYISQWLHARQLVRNQSLRSGRTRNVACRVLWAPHSISPRPQNRPQGSLVLTRLPYPFVILSSGSFPLRTLEEGLSPAQIRSLAR